MHECKFPKQVQSQTILGAKGAVWQLDRVLQCIAPDRCSAERRILLFDLSISTGKSFTLLRWVGRVAAMTIMT